MRCKSGGSAVGVMVAVATLCAVMVHEGGDAGELGWSGCGWRKCLRMVGMYGGEVAVIGIAVGWLHVEVLRGLGVTEEGWVLAERGEEEEGVMGEGMRWLGFCFREM